LVTHDESDEGKYGVDAVYKYEWIRNDYWYCME